MSTLTTPMISGSRLWANEAYMKSLLKGDFDEHTIFFFWLADDERREAMKAALRENRLPVWPKPYAWRNSEQHWIALKSVYGLMKQLGHTLDEALENTKFKTWGYVEKPTIINPHFPSAGRYDREVKKGYLREEIPKVMANMEEFGRRLAGEL